MTNKRPTIDDGPNVGHIRHDRYAAAIERYNESFRAGFYVESIAIIESLIGDRLESLANQISDGKMSYKTVSKLAEYLLGKGQVSLFDSEFIFTLQSIQKWFGDRSFAIHEMGKLAPDMKETFDDSYSRLQNIAKDGMTLFRQVDNYLRIFRPNKH